MSHLTGTKRDEYEKSLKRYRDSLDIFETAREDGHEEGRAEGLAEGIAEGERNAMLATARNMKSDGMPIDIIVKYTHLSPSEIAEL